MKSRPASVNSARVAARERRNLGNGGFVGKRVEPRDLDAHALADQPEFAEMLGQRRHLGAIAAVERRQRGQRCKRVESRHDVAGRARGVYHGGDVVLARRVAQGSRVSRWYNSHAGRTYASAYPSRFTPCMKLLSSQTSPYARKVRIALAEKKIEYELVEASPWDAGTSVPAINPLGKVPVLMLDDGTALYDSRVIVEYLDTVSPVSRLIPEPSRQRIAVKRWEALADGICDAAVLIVRESKRPARAAERGMDRASARKDRSRPRGFRDRARRQAVVQRRRVFAGRHRHRVRARLSRLAPRGDRLARANTRIARKARRKARRSGSRLWIPLRRPHSTDRIGQGPTSIPSSPQRR